MDEYPTGNEFRSHIDLMMERSRPGADQKLLAPLEHRAYAREYVQDNPVMGPVSMAVAIPAYTALKALGVKKARSPASVHEMVQGYAGILDGLRLLSR